MRDDYLQAAMAVINDPSILVNVVSTRVKQLKRGNRPLITSLEKLMPEDVALREISERKITYELATPDQLAAIRPAGWRSAAVSNVHGTESASAKSFKAAASG